MSQIIEEAHASGNKRRNAEATKTSLLVAARIEFHKAGYEGASMRQIASDAGCNVALINRYFGSKKGLFEAVMGACFDLTPLKGLSTEKMVSALVDIALEKANLGKEFDPMVVAVRSSGSSSAQGIISKQLGNPMVEELASIIGGKEAQQKAGVILSMVSGIFVGRVSIGAQALSSDEDEVIRPLLTAAFHAVLSAGKTTPAVDGHDARNEPQHGVS
ncbi:MAG: TetR family transcriptional regulator [Pseudomonadota bacterium]